MLPRAETISITKKKSGEAEKWEWEGGTDERGGQWPYYFRKTARALGRREGFRRESWRSGRRNSPRFTPLFTLLPLRAYSLR